MNSSARLYINECPVNFIYGATLFLQTAAAAAPVAVIRINQLGYLPDAPKVDGPANLVYLLAAMAGEGIRARSR